MLKLMEQPVEGIMRRYVDWQLQCLGPAQSVDRRSSQFSLGQSSATSRGSFASGASSRASNGRDVSSVASDDDDDSSTQSDSQTDSDDDWLEVRSVELA